MKNLNISVDIGGLKFKNPIIAASGTFGFGREYSNFYDLSIIGGISVKGLTLEARGGNPPPRIAETNCGIINSVGLQNPGVEAFIKNEIPFLRKYNTKIIANVAGNTIEDYCKMAEILDEQDIDAIELNVSCPNVKNGCMSFGSSISGINEVVKAVRKRYKKNLIVKLTPNVTDIKEIAKSAEEAGADAISLINTVLGMAVDIKNKRPILANNYGGLSGPAIKPIALRMVHEVWNSVEIPIIGMGGITCTNDIIEFMLCGARAVMIGTYNFVNPNVCKEAVEGLIKYMKENNIKDINEIVGGLIMN